MQFHHMSGGYPPFLCQLKCFQIYLSPTCLDLLYSLALCSTQPTARPRRQPLLSAQGFTPVGQSVPLALRCARTRGREAPRLPLPVSQTVQGPPPPSPLGSPAAPARRPARPRRRRPACAAAPPRRAARPSRRAWGRARGRVARLQHRGLGAVHVQVFEVQRHRGRIALRPL